MDVSHFQDRKKDGSFDLEAYEATLEHKPNHGKIEVAKPEAGSDEWSSDSDAMSCEDSSDDSEMQVDDGKHKKMDKKLNPKKNTVGLTKKMVEARKKKEFFKDMRD